jgi:hypothetical protein
MKLIVGIFGAFLGLLFALPIILEFDLGSLSIFLVCIIMGLGGAAFLVKRLFSDSLGADASYASSPIPERSAKGSTGVVDVDTLCRNLLVFQHVQGAKFEVAIMRQSGNIHRAYVCENVSAAMKLVISTFNRKRVRQVRIWQNNANSADVRINYYHGRGSSEGKVVAGVCIRKV